SPHLCVLAKGPFDTTFFHHPWHGVGVCVRDESGRGFLAWSIWLDHRAYVPYALRDDPNLTDAALIALESEGSQRLPQARSLLAAVLERAKQDPDLPVLVGGDFNTPSHLDWTLDTARTYRFRRALPLPVSLAMHEAHFADTFRQVHPNPVQQPGITWTPLFRGKGAEKPACFDRIDRLYLRPPQAETDWILLPVAAQTLPEVWEDDELPTKERTFPSDHCALLVDLRWVPANR
ncbi:MAG: hypothetical protein O2816_11800, partial [Planctomycetota bacterium]|nr:hypothetical protein [Planctomycetota bacterium]